MIRSSQENGYMENGVRTSSLEHGTFEISDPNQIGTSTLMHSLNKHLGPWTILDT